MSIVRALRPKQPERSTVPMWQLASLFPGAAVSGYTNAGGIERALTYAAVWACIDVITDPISRTPVDVVRYVDGTRQAIEPLPRLIAAPNPQLVTDDVWRTQAAFSFATQGNAVGYVIATDRRGYPVEVQLVDPYQASLEVKNGRKWIGVGGHWSHTWEFGGDFFHIPGRHVRAGSPYALSPCKYAGETIGLGIAAREFSNSFFSEGGNPKAGLISDRDLTPEQATEIKAAYLNAIRPGSREPFVHGSGLSYEQYSVQPGETQFIDLMRFINEEAARVWRVPPSSISAAMSGQSVTYTSVGDEDIRKLKDTLDGYFVRMEKALGACLPNGQVVKFNRNAILRSDPKTRNEVYDVRLKNKTMSINEVRRLEDEEPFADPMYDDPGIPGGPIMDAPAALNPQGTP